MIKYYTVAYIEDFLEVKQQIISDIGSLSKLQKVGTPQDLMGNYRIVTRNIEKYFLLYKINNFLIKINCFS